MSDHGPVEGLGFLGRTGLDKPAHALEFGLLAILTMRALCSSGVGSFPIAAAVAAVLCTAYAVFDEYHQLGVPGRTSDWLDAAADAAGIALAIAIWKIPARKWPGLMTSGTKNENTAC